MGRRHEKTDLGRMSHAEKEKTACKGPEVSILVKMRVPAGV